MRIKYTTKHNALNPVARSVAHQRLAQSFLLQKLKLYSWAAGDACNGTLREIQETLRVLSTAAKLDSLQRHNPNISTVDFGIELCDHLAGVNYWQPDAAFDIEQALDAALVLYKKINPRFIGKAK